jgi:hypothetical protein
MPLHLLKMAVGIEDIAQLERIRALRAAERGGHWISTRNRPRRAPEVLAGGSIYWVIRGRIRVRQRVLGFREGREGSGRRTCLIDVDGALVPTLARPCRPFQGWRYLLPADAPPDRPGAEAPAGDALFSELRSLGLL